MRVHSHVPHARGSWRAVGGDGLQKFERALVRQIFMKEITVHAYFQEADITDDDGLLGITDSQTFTRTLSAL